MKKTLLFLPAVFFHLALRSQVPVSREPKHHDVLDNAHVRLLDVHILPGDTTQFHIHQTPSVFLMLKEVKSGSQVTQEDSSKSIYRHEGNVWFEGFYKVARIHRVWNSDTTEFRVMDIELPNKHFIVPDPLIRNEGFTFVLEEKPVRVYRLNLLPGSEISLKARKADILMIQTTDAAENVRVNEKSFHQMADFLYIPSGKDIQIKNAGLIPGDFVFLELK